MAKIDWVTRQIQKLIDWMLENYTSLRVLDYHTLLNLQEGHAISQLKVSSDSWLSDKKLENLDLKSEGIMNLSFEKSEGMINGVLTGDDIPSAGDVLTLYGKKG